jgi:hypothetical protein
MGQWLQAWVDPPPHPQPGANINIQLDLLTGEGGGSAHQTDFSTSKDVPGSGTRDRRCKGTSPYKQARIKQQNF